MTDSATASTAPYRARQRKRAAARSEAFVADALGRYGSAVYRLAYVRLESRADAEDVCQDVFLKLAYASVDFANDEHLKAWLLHVAVNRCREIARRPWRRRAADAPTAAFSNIANPPEPAAPDDTAGEAMAHVETEAIRRAISRLAPKYREVIHLFYQEELSCSEIARILGTKESTVRTRLQRAREQLRPMLREVAR